MSNLQLEIITIEPKQRDDHNGNGTTEGSHCNVRSGKTKDSNENVLSLGVKHRKEKLPQRNSCNSALVDIELAVPERQRNLPTPVEQHSPMLKDSQGLPGVDKMNLALTNDQNPSTILSSSAIGSSSQTNLVRKHSCGDLVSRLKSRKILGVGESSENRGEVYRSKISQLLGHSEHLFARFPLAFWHWYACIIILNVLFALWNLFGHLFIQRNAAYRQESASSSDAADQMQDLLVIGTFFRQFCGIVHLALTTFIWRFYRINDKSLVRFILLVCSALSFFKIILLLYYDHCSVIGLKNWLSSSFCPSECAPDSAADRTAAATAALRPCSQFASLSIFSSIELTIYLVWGIVEMLVNLWYRRRMGHIVNTSSSVLITGAIGARRASAPHPAISTCEYVSYFANTYLVSPISRLFRPSDDQHISTTTNISVPVTPTTLKQPRETNIPEESEETAGNTETTALEKKDAKQDVQEHHHKQ